MEWMDSWPADGLAVGFQLWVDGFARVLAVAVLAMLFVVVLCGVLDSRGTAKGRRRFWCPLARREVEVEFETRGLLHGPASVKRCSAFETATSISCRRRCLDASFRRQWEHPLARVA